VIRPIGVHPLLQPPVGPGDHALGLAGAPLQLVEYGDFECPRCRQAHGNIQRIRRDLGDQLLFVFRHFPLGKSHPHARQAAEASEAAAAQGKFWEMHDLMYRYQEQLELEHLIGYARQIGLDVERFRDELANRTYAARVHEDAASGVRSGVNTTPTLYTHGRRFNGGYEHDRVLESLRDGPVADEAR